MAVDVHRYWDSGNHAEIRSFKTIVKQEHPDFALR